MIASTVGCVLSGGTEKMIVTNGRCLQRKTHACNGIMRSFRLSSSSSTLDETPSKPNRDYLTNGGTVEGVWIFCRHGDRAPSRPLCPAHMIETEVGFWNGRLPRPDSLECFKGYSKYFPPDIHPSNDGQFLDVRRAPFGFLTQTGIDQTRENGARLFKRYNRHGHHRPEIKQYLNAKDFLDVWDVRVYSTNYLRTVMSVQSFLDGLLGTQCHLTFPETIEYAEGESSDETRIPNHNSVPREPGKDALLTVQVRGREEDTLNAFDRNPDLMAELVSEVISSPEFQERDSAAATLAARLANILPGLARAKRNTHGFNAAPSGINWIEASDHFICRSAHNLSFSQFSNFEHDDRVEEMLVALSHQTTAHLAWRFRQWYKSPRLLASIAAPPLREIAEQLVAAPTLGDHDRHPFTIYSCHDVTILGLLYGIGAEFLACDEKGGWRFWPEYACSLVFELVRTDSDFGDNEGGSHVVRVLLNGRPIKSVDLHNHFWKGAGILIGKGPNGMLLAEDFVEMVQRLEQAGGYDRSTVQVEETPTTKDMSNWTG